MQLLQRVIVAFIHQSASAGFAEVLTYCTQTIERNTCVRSDELLSTVRANKTLPNYTLETGCPFI